ncbi:hypothetical protein HPB47_011949 [Ixodes persulcatus]|uniref:Uncharacterized protein n=1 Tax=Ixodes persulcatus TaxID=34615 RepID=A0AC60NUZ0_IXOPE|nr:hypothetical protein HPB47_011949 [Ixodes persulcatus]
MTLCTGLVFNVLLLQFVGTRVVWTPAFTFHDKEEDEEKREHRRTAGCESGEGLDLGVAPGQVHQRLATLQHRWHIQSCRPDFRPVPSPYGFLVIKLKEKEADKSRQVKRSSKAAEPRFGRRPEERRSSGVVPRTP